MCGSIDIHIQLPLPPSVNRILRRTKTGMARSEKYRAWRREAGWMLNLAKPNRVSGAYGIKILLPADMHGDIDNRVKVAIDLFVSHGITDDDKFCTEQSSRRDPNCPKGQCIVHIYSTSPMRDRGAAGSELADQLAPMPP